MTAYDRLLVVWAPALGSWAVRLLAATLRIRREEESARPFWARRAPVIYAIWHGRILLIPWLYGRAHPVNVMASRSRDGELVARFVRRFGFKTVRGSTTRGGSDALRRLARVLRWGQEVAVVPDGPLGPRGIVRPGVIALARITGAPILPLAFSAYPAWRLRSWDEFLIPKPFARAAVCFGPPLFVPSGADRSQQEALRKELEVQLSQLTWRVDGLVREP